ncbi:LysR family transcriptional regulator [Algirhabdus cladophorae]|uniref:LysR family transcriptional regulator n=1 Tax=Algirhabdus cladophorae TaxID=3377108 RepID=UPI003B846C88
MTLDQIKTFLAVVRLKGVGKAAAALNLTQPAITVRIKNLEETLDCVLFDRGPDGMILTKRGELLLGFAEQFEFLTQQVEEAVIAPDGIEGHLRLGVSETIAQSWLPDLITRLHGLFPKLKIELNVDISTTLRGNLLNREIDLAILLGPISEYSVNNVVLPGFDLAWYTATTPANDANLMQKPVLTYARNTRPYREVKEMLFERYGPSVSLFPSSSLSACFRLVEAGLGIAVLPRLLGKEFVDTGKIREFDPGWRPSPLEFSASYLGEPRSHMIETAAKIALDVANTFSKS